jgi:hypothetical protein
MAMDKALNRAPRGLASALMGGAARGALRAPSPLGEDDEDLGENPDTGSQEEDGNGNIIVLVRGDEDEGDDTSEESESQEKVDDTKDDKFNENLADGVIPEDKLVTLSSDLIADFDDDIASRKEWVNTYVDGLELLGMKIEERTEPWEGACGVYHPLLSEALVKFQAETMMETFPASGPVKTRIIGKETRDKKEASGRVSEDMNFQLTEKMVEYRPEHERLLWGVGLSGNGFKKIYFDPTLRRQTAMFVPAEDLVVPYGASSIQTAERVTHVMRKTPNEVKKLQAAGFYRDAELGEPTKTFDEVEKKIAEKMGFSATTDDRFKLLEMHVELVIEEDEFVDGDDIARPYVVTIEKGQGTVLAIRRNWKSDDDNKLKRNHFVHYAYIPGFGFYAFGLIHLIGAFAKSGTSIIRQLVDAGTLSNLPGGFKTKGMRVKGDDTPIGPGEWRDVDIASGAMRDNILPLPYKEPSQVLAALLQTIVDEGRRFASAADLKVSDMSSESPVGTTLAILERTMKVISAVQARIYYSMKQEFKLLRDIIRDYTPDTYAYEPDTGDSKAKRSDYDTCEVIPVADPNASTLAQKVVQYQAVIQLAQMAPQIYDLPFLHRQMLEVLSVPNAAKIVPMDDDQKPRDPVAENMAIINGKPVKAFIYQDHQAHITVHTAAMQDPTIMQLMGQNPKAPMIMAAAQAHIAEHIAFEYRKQIEEQAGVPYPYTDPDDTEADEMSPEEEVAISRLAAAAAQQVLAANQDKAQQQQAQQQAQDPIVQQAQEELKLKGREVDLKEKKTQADIAAKADQLEIERERIAAQERIAGLQVGAKVATAKEQLSSQQQLEGLRIGVEVAKESAAQGHQKDLKGLDHASKAALADQAAAQSAQAVDGAAPAAAAEEAPAPDAGSPDAAAPQSAAALDEPPPPDQGGAPPDTGPPIP